MTAETTTSIRGPFVDRFGEDNAAAIEAAAQMHRKGYDTRGLGSDPFKWALLIAIGFQCIDQYTDYHHITTDPDELKTWVYENADLASHDGDCDMLSLIGGGYDGWVKRDEDKS